MAICRRKLKMTQPGCSTDPSIAARLALVVAAMLAVMSLNARAAGGELSKSDKQCLACHSTKGLEMKLANGEVLSLYVDGASFAKSVHSMIGCAVCHGDITTDNHPPLKTKMVSVRENAIALQKVCSSCHGDKFKAYEGSVHASLLRDGNAIAPVCTDCHSPHEVMAKSSYDAASGAPCSKCHGAIFEAYAGSVHGRARKQGHTLAPVCSNCHSAHDVKPVATEGNIREACLGCHPGALPAHQVWLPNAERHLQTISCPACHSPGAKRRVDLRLYDRSTQERIAEKEGVPRFEMRARAIDTEGKGLNAIALQSLLREFSRDGAEGEVSLRGRLEVESGIEAHQLADKTRAVAQCESCHRAGSDPFQRVTISIAAPDGRALRYDARQDVLSSAISVDSIGGFYVIGATRIKLLDILVILSLLAGIGVPIAHLTFGWLSRKYAKRIGGREDS